MNIERPIVKFISGFAIISRRPQESRELYLDSLGLPLKEVDKTGYFMSDDIEGSKHFGIWPLEMAAEACFGKKGWPGNLPVPQSSIEFEVGEKEDVERYAEILKQDGFSLLHEAKTEPWGQTVARLQSPEGNIVGVTYTPHMH